MLKTLFQICIIFIHLTYTQGQSVYNKQSPNLSRIDQTYVYHTNGNLWMGWDSYGNTGDQTCSGIIPGWVYPGGSGLNYNCRAGYWIIADIGGTLYEGTTGQYDVSEGTVPGATSGGWAGADGDYNKEPWITNSTWTIPSVPGGGLTVNAVRRSWSTPGESNKYFKVGEHDYNDFVIDEVHIINTSTSNVDGLVFGSKADHDCTWNVPNPDWNYAFWTDDIIDYDEETFLTMQLDGDRQDSANNDFGIDDPGRQYRGVRVGQAPLNIADISYSSLLQSDVNHMWWTGDEDPQTAASRYSMATRVKGSGDKKNENPPPMDMRYLQSYGPYPLAAGDTLKFIVAVVAGSGLEEVKQAVFNARQAYDWNYNLPKPPSAPQMTSDAVEVLSDGSVKVSWSYTDDQISAIDPDKGVADFAGFRIYRSIGDSVNAADLFSEEGIIIESDADIDESTPYYPNQTGPFSLVAEIPSSDISNYFDYTSYLYQWTDANTQLFSTHWYYVAAFDEAGSDAVHGSIIPSLESYYTMCYPMVVAPELGGGGELIPGINMDGIIPYSEDQSVLSETVSGTLTLSESPYYVLNDVVTSGQVTIEPGVEIIFVYDASFSGSFNAQGSETDSIRFYNMNDRINGTLINTGNSTFSHCVFDIYFRSEGGSLSITHSVSFYIYADHTALDITYSNFGVNASYCTGNITNNTVDDFLSFNYCNNMVFENNVFKGMIYITESNKITFKKNLFLGNLYPYKWSRMFNLVRDTNVTIINNTFSEIDMAAGYSESEPAYIIGIPDGGESLDIDIRNNIFWNISDTTNACVIRNHNGSDLNIEYNNIQGGADEVYGSHSWGSGNINEDPLFTDSENGDFTLQFGSPCIDTGDPDSPLDSDGTRADMGAFEAILELTVYSGDTDNNGVVNVYDVLPIGIYFHDVGIAYDPISYVWEPRTVYPFENIAATYADANGDGKIDEKDVIGIGVNWGNIHDNGNAMFTINLNDTLLINEHRESFRQIYNSLAGESQSSSAMRSLLSNILDINIPLEFSLHQNFPNPFNSGTTISFSLPGPTEVSLVIYNLLGRVISKPIENIPYQAGSHDFKIVNTDLVSGIYFFQIQTGTHQSTKKMVLLK